MKTSFIIFSILSLFCLTAQAAHHAVLVAGSNSFMNYRHQADIFHSYQLMVKHGIPADNIITFAYDDIANDPENPFPGKVFNRPNGTDVYAGVKIDYSGADVTPENFLAAIKGDSNTTNGKKVLKSGPLDRVFIYFSDHGADGLIAFPSTYLYANDFIQALTYMSNHTMYKEMVIYIEACESGSMFDGLLPNNINIYATTAANSEESSWATYCSPDDFVNGTEIGSCLGDLYSVNFLEDLDIANVTQETLLNQFTKIMKETNLSHVEKFGSMAIDREMIGNFEGNGLADDVPVVTESPREYRKTSVVNSRWVKLAYLNRRHERFQTEQTRKELMDEFESIERLDDIFNTLQNKFKLNLKTPIKNINFDCLKQRVAIYEDLCGKFSDYGLKYVRYISQTCNQNVGLYDYELALLDLC